MKTCRLLCALCLLGTISLFAQERPLDFLPASFHKMRREALREKLPDRSVAIFFANAVRNRANDVEYVYHQDPNFYYLTGYQEPDAILVLFSDWQTDASGEKYNEIMFARARDPRMEMWTGRRLGPEGVREKLQFDKVLDHRSFKDYLPEFKKFEKVLFFDFKNDVRDNPSDDADLYSLIEQFKDKANVPANFNGRLNSLYSVLQDPNLDLVRKKERLYQMTRRNPRMLEDPVLKSFMAAKDPEVVMKIVDDIPETNLDTYTLPQLMGQLRETKSPEEIRLMRMATDISAVGQIEVMKAMRPNMSETEVQGIHEFVFKKYGAEYEGYPSIVGAGNNGCILHYVDNNKPRLGTDLVLMDLGAEYHGYTADVTRTIPASGTFTEEQKAIYNIVLEAQDAGFEECRVGNDFRAPNAAARAVIDRRLAELGIIEEGEEHPYFPHGTSHYVGLDVHDPGTYQPFQPGTIITVEPGIYIPEGSPCDKKWWGIAVRIEDCILITESGWENLSGRAPRKVEDIEDMMAKPSALDDFVLPSLEKR